MANRRAQYPAPAYGYRNNFNTTYGTSYKDVPTLEVSPVYEDFREQRSSPRRYDDDGPRSYRGGFDQRDDGPRSYRGEYEQRDEGPRSFRGEYEQRVEGRGGYDQREEYNGHSPRHNDGPYAAMERNMEQRAADPRYGPRDQFRELMVKEEPIPFDTRNVFCHKCFRNKVCVNRLSCAHQYCDDCMRTLPGSDNPFRDSIRWHYKCGKCDPPSWTNEMKLVRYNPYGQRLMKYSDVRYYDKPDKE